jgi:hypothetical protein
MDRPRLAFVVAVDVILMGLLVLAQQPTTPPPVPDTAVLDARIGPCSADFTVRDESGAPVYAATIHVRVRYGFWNIKRSDLEVGTNADGRARIEGLPDKARPLRYDITFGEKKGTAMQDLSTTCHGRYDVALK